MAIGKLAVTRPCAVVARNTIFLSQGSFLFGVEQIDRRARSKCESLRKPFEPATPNLESVADT